MNPASTNLLDLLLFFLSLAFPTSIGWILFTVLDRSGNRFFFWERIFLSFGLGFGILTLVMFYMSLCGVHFSILKIGLLTSLPVLATAFFCTRSTQNRKSSEALVQNAKQTSSPWKFYEVILLLLIIFALIFLSLRTYLIENDKWDTWAVWFFKAKVYFIEAIIPFAKYAQFRTVWGNWDYPHHFPLLGTWTFLCLDKFNEQLARMMSLIFHFGLVVCLYAFFRKLSSRMASLCGAFFIMTIPILNELVVGAYTEPGVLFYYILSLRFLLEWKDKNDNKCFYLSAVFAGLAAWTKNEGIVYFLFNLCIILMMTRNRKFLINLRYIFVYIAIFAVIICPWLVLKSSLGLTNILINSELLSLPNLINNSSKLDQAILSWLNSLSTWDGLNLMRIMFFTYLLIAWKTILQSSQKYLLVSIIFHLFLACGFYLLDPSTQFLKDSFNRLLMAPCILIIMLIFTDTALKQGKEEQLTKPSLEK